LGKKGWTSPSMPNNKQQLPEVNYDALVSRAGKKRGRYLAFILLILLLGGALFFFRDRLSWFAHVLTSEPSTATQSTSNAENPRPPVPQPKLKPKKLAEAELPSTANSETNERVTRSIVSAEVIFPGGQRRTIYPHNAAVNVDLEGSTKPTSTQTQPATAVATAVNPTEHEKVPADSPEVLDHPEPVYPRLAEEMKVQGSVTLQVNIDKNGNIVHTQVLSGPEILANAAKEAVRLWRFRPRYENGALIETDARVVVNFTISTR
jgi:TonB family protein